MTNYVKLRAKAQKTTTKWMMSACALWPTCGLENPSEGARMQSNHRSSLMWMFLLQHLWFGIVCPSPCETFAVCLLWSFQWRQRMSKANKNVRNLLTNSTFLVSPVCSASASSLATVCLHFVAHFCISASREFSSSFIKPICSYCGWLRKLGGSSSNEYFLI